MRGRVWTHCFFQVCRKLEVCCGSIIAEGKWTSLMGEVMDEVAKKMGCFNVRK